MIFKSNLRKLQTRQKHVFERACKIIKCLRELDGSSASKLNRALGACKDPSEDNPWDYTAQSAQSILRQPRKINPRRITTLEILRGKKKHSSAF